MPRGQSSGPVELNVETTHVRAAIRALAEEADGRRLRLDLGRNMRVVLTPVVAEAKSNIMSAPSSGVVPHGSDRGMLRVAIARQVSVRTRLAGAYPTVSLVAGTKGMPRGFTQAPRRMNAPKWRHPVFGNTNKWVDQVGAPRWFSGPAYKHRPEYVAAVVAAVDEMTARIAARSLGA